MTDMVKLCQCGCGNPVAHETNAYIMGHNNSRHGKTIIPEIRYCKCGCGTPVKYARALYALGHHNIGKPGRNKGMHWKMSLDCHKAQHGLTAEHKVHLVEALKRRTTTEQTKEKLRQIMRGNKKCGSQTWVGRHHTEESKQLIGSKSKNRNWAKGERAGNWLGGLSFEPYSEDFNEQLKYLIRVRDGFTCQLCGMPERENGRLLSVHHIDYDKMRSLPTNLISLCTSCNLRVNVHRKHWTAYFLDVLNNRQINPKALVRDKRKVIPNIEQMVMKLVEEKQNG